MIACKSLTVVFLYEIRNVLFELSTQHYYILNCIFQWR